MSDELDTSTPQVSAAEVEARTFGWVPQDEYKGNPDDWKDADTFLRRGKEINGFLRKDMEKLNNKLAQKDNELAEVRATIEEFKKYHSETAEREYKRALESLKREKKEAIEQGDGERVIEIEEAIDGIKEAQKTAAPKPKTQEQPKLNEFDEWVLDNKWFVTNEQAKYLAELYGKELSVKSPQLRGREFLDAVGKRVKDEHPDLFENPARAGGAVSSSSDGRVPPSKKKKGYNDLPPDAKRACDRFVKQGLMTQEKYVSEYQWD